MWKLAYVCMFIVYLTQAYYNGNALYQKIFCSHMLFVELCEALISTILFLLATLKSVYESETVCLTCNWYALPLLLGIYHNAIRVSMSNKQQ